MWCTVKSLKWNLVENLVSPRFYQARFLSGTGWKFRHSSSTQLSIFKLLSENNSSLNGFSTRTFHIWVCRSTLTISIWWTLSSFHQHLALARFLTVCTLPSIQSCYWPFWHNVCHFMHFHLHATDRAHAPHLSFEIWDRNLEYLWLVSNTNNGI